MNPCQDTYNDCLPCQDCPPAPNAINLPPCVDGEPCEEILGADCVFYDGPNLPALGIKDNDRLTTVLLKLHEMVNATKPVSMKVYTATSTTAVPFVVDYLGLGPVYRSTPGATSAGTVVNVSSTTGLAPGMLVALTTGTGLFAPGTIVLSLTPTSFVVNTVPLIPLTGSGNIVTATGSSHAIYEITVLSGIPQAFNAFSGSPVIVSGEGTLI